ncbi:MAG: hypothetical protein GC184_14420 [Rhizobiales bacterium]|nr:hypothetical protein [Hyphomicrobiales bacterium]
MTAHRTAFFIQALVDTPVERPPFIMAARQLGRRLSVATGEAHKIETLFENATASGNETKTPDMIIMSLLGGLTAVDKSMTELETTWRLRIEALMTQHQCPVFICTIFRHVPKDQIGVGQPSRAWTLERIRRINLLALELSQSLGVNVIDIDRALTYIGARSAQTDYRLRGRLGTFIAGDVIATILATAGLDDLVSPDDQIKLQRMSGGIQGIVYRLPQWQKQLRSEGDQHVGA